MESRGPPRVKNKAAAPIQISAEQLLREAVDRQEPALQAPTQRFSDLEELHEFQGRKRKEFEDYVRRNRLNVTNWLRYADWEISQKEFARGRSVFERALDTNAQDVRVWIRYIDNEIKSRSINHARNLLDRAVSILPRQTKLWFKYVYVEETLGAFANCRAVFERWMSWQPDVEAWSAYIKFEKRYGEFDRVRAVYERFVAVHPEPRNWIKWARFEEEFGTSELVREVYGVAVETLESMGGIDFLDEKLCIAYARFEAKLKEYERSRAILKFGLDRLPRSKANVLHKSYTTFEKQFGDREGVEDAILSKRRVQYEEEVKRQPKNYDSWITLARLEEDAGDPGKVREVYERAIAQKPTSFEKRHWRRYIYLWVFYALFEETVVLDVPRARAIYSACIEQLPHKKFSFAKIWLAWATFEIRQGQLTTARKLLGRALGTCPYKNKLYREYIGLELKLYEFARCRTLYEQWITNLPSNAQGWIKFSELERGLEDPDRARAILELAVNQDELDMPELVWKAYIDFEEEQEDSEASARSNALYERLLKKTNHVKVWISYAQSVLNQPDPDEPEPTDDVDEGAEHHFSPTAIARARKVFERAGAGYKSAGDGSEIKESRVALLTAWKSFEAAHGSDADKEAIEKQMPRRVKRRRKLDDDSFEEYMDYVFPADDEQAAKFAKLLERSQAWKRQKVEMRPRLRRREVRNSGRLAQSLVQMAKAMIDSFDR